MFLASVPDLGADAVRTAVAAAAAAFPGWSAVPGKRRAAALLKWHDLLLAHTDDLAKIMTAENGKPLSESRGEVQYAADYVLWFSQECTRGLDGETLPSVALGHRGFTVRQPVGVCAALTPANFPTAMLARKAAAALAAGCTMVAKPSEATPFSALAFAELGLRAGVPPGVLSVITGEAAPISEAMMASQDVRKVTFTGSTRVGKLLMQACGATMKRSSMELGGNAPFLVFPDADLDAAVNGVMSAKFRNAGQTCISANRFYVADSVYDAFAAALAAKMQASLRMGPGNVAGNTVGPLINRAAVAKCQRHVDDCVAKGARVVLGRDTFVTAANEQQLAHGHFFAPTLLVDVPPNALPCVEETFGPVVALVRLPGDDEAGFLRHANATDAGLAAYVFTTDAARLFRVAERIQAGMVGLNTGIASACSTAPFGGVRDSGHGREGSKHGIHEYTELKYLSMAV